MADLEQLTSEKEKELNQLRLQHALQVSNTIKSMEQELEREKERVFHIQTDFNYNLSLLSSRDQELSRYEAAFVELKRIINVMVAENSELKVRLDGACKELEGSKESQLELKVYYQSRIKEIHSRMDSYRCSKQSELDAERNKLEQLQRELERRLVDLEGETQCQRDQLMADFEQALRQRDYDHQQRVDQLSSTLLTNQSKNRQLERELEHCQSVIACLQEEVKEKVSEIEGKEREQRDLAWQLETEVQRLENRITELEREKEKCCIEIQRKQQSFQKKHAELDKLVREREANLKAAKELHLHCKQSLEDQCVELHALLEEREGEWQQRESRLQQTIRDKEELVERAHAELSIFKLSSSEEVKEQTRQIVERDLQIQALQDTIQGRDMDLQDREKELAHLQSELSQTFNKVRTLEQIHAQQRLEWEGRKREAERLAYSQQQDIVKQLTDAKNKLTAECQELQAMLNEQAQVTESLQTKHLGGDQQEPGHSTELQKVQAQNDQLCSIIKQMRMELENLSDSSGKREIQQGTDGMPSVDYIHYLENEVRRLKSDNRQLVERLQSCTPQGKPPASNSSKKKSSPHSAVERIKDPPSPAPPPIDDTNLQHQSHLIALSSTIASLQKEKAELERKSEEWKSMAEQLQDKLKEDQEMAYIMKACSVPQTKLHEKLIQATQVIIALVKDKEVLSTQINHLTTKSVELKQDTCKTDQSTQTQEMEQKMYNGQFDAVHGTLQGVDYSQTTRESIANQNPRLPTANRFTDQEDNLPVRRENLAQSQPTRFDSSPKWEDTTSLASLQFTESSVDRQSLDKVIALVDNNYGELFSVDASQGAAGVNHSTPEPLAGGLELVGKEMKAHMKPGQRIIRANARFRTGTSSKSKAKVNVPRDVKVRNYNIKDDTVSLKMI